MPGLTVRVKEGLKLADSRVVQHLHNLARALVRPQDEVAWAGALRGPWGPQALCHPGPGSPDPGGSVAGEIAPVCRARVTAPGN